MNFIYSEVKDVYHNTIINVINFIPSLWSTSVIQSTFGDRGCIFLTFRFEINLEVELERYNNKEYY
jgi:hypothetical protein